MSKFLEVKFTGGLGNQLFQYATGRNLCIKNNIPYLLLNTESYRNDPLGRKFGLTHFKIKGFVIKNEFSQKIFRKGTWINRLISGLPVFHLIEEDGLRLHSFPDSTRLVISLTGYWQSEQYFKDIRSILLNELTLSDLPQFPEWQKRKNSVAVHIRRMDYLAEDGFGALSEQYYHDAMEMMRNKINEPSFIFFSDNIEWCKEKFRDENFFYCEEKEWEKDYLQLYLMSKCSHQIIANSSFSWWGAWLNNNPDKIVMKPERPFIDSSLMYERYYPDDWISIKNY